VSGKMEASEEHMVKEHKTIKKMDSTVLDCFTALADNNEECRIEAGVRLLKHVFGKQGKFQDEGVCPELQYTLNRLVRGVASSRVTARKGFYAAFVGLLSAFPFLTVEDVLAALKKELHSANSSKSEEADIYTGHILLYGALIRSGLLFKGTAEEQMEVFNSAIEAGSKRSYLVLPSHTFLIILLNKIEEQSFQDCIWPVLKGRIKPLPELSLEVLHFVLVARARYPHVVKKKFLLTHIGTTEIINEDSVQACAKLLMTVRNFSDLYHPVHEEFCKQLSQSSLLSVFWEQGIEGQLEKPSDSKKYIAMQMFYYVLKHTEDKSQVPSMLTPRFLDVVVRSLEKLAKKLVTKTDRVCARTHEVFVSYMLTTLKDENVKDKTLVAIIKKLTFSAGGELMFDRMTGTRIVQNLLGMLKARGVKKVAGLFKDVISGTTDKSGGLSGEDPRPWNNKERMYATDLFARILGLPPVMGDVEWKTEQVHFLLHKGFFYPHSKEQDVPPIGALLADSLQQSFFRVLNQRLSKMEDVRTLLSTLVHDVDRKIAAGEYLLRQPLQREALDAWQKLTATSDQLEQVTVAGSREMLARVFHTMFLYMGLQLLADPKMAKDALEELHGCYERVEKEQKESKKKRKRLQAEGDEEEEPMWVEVAVDLILSLLSQSSCIPKNMLDIFFFHLCPHLTGAALGQITKVLDPTVEENPLTRLGSREEEDIDEDESSESENDSDSRESDSEESESDVEDEGNETVSDKLRAAVRDALGFAAPLTDTESVDIDDMDEEEGRRLNKALSEAFSMLRGSKTNKKSKKQLNDDRILMHFRIRAIDLLEVYLKSDHVGTEASLFTYIDIMLVLFSLLEFCIRDVHQKPLENRVRSCLKRLSSAKKNVSLEGVTEETIADALKQLVEKGENTSGPIFLDMGPKVIECCTFLVRCCQRLIQHSASHSRQHKGTSPVVEIYKNALTTFFTKRDCLHQPGLFRSVLTSVWDGNWELVPVLINCAFDPKIRPFRQNQALDLLIAFFHNRRLRTMPDVAQCIEPRLADTERLLSDNTVRWLQTQMADISEGQKSTIGHGVKQKFVHHLLTLLATVWQGYSPNNKGGPNVDWSSLGSLLMNYRERNDLSGDAKSSFNKLARLLGIKWVPVKKEKKPTSERKASVSDDLLCSNEKGENVMDVNGGDKGSQKGGEDGDETLNSKKQGKKEKGRHKNMSQNKAKLKKEARELRLASLSEGLENVTFSGLKMDLEDDVETEDSEVEKLVNSTHNGLVNGESKKKSKVYKRKTVEMGHNTVTSKRMR